MFNGLGVITNYPASVFIVANKKLSNFPEENQDNLALTTLAISRSIDKLPNQEAYKLKVFRVKDKDCDKIFDPRMEKLLHEIFLSSQDGEIFERIRSNISPIILNFLYTLDNNQFNPIIKTFNSIVSKCFNSHGLVTAKVKKILPALNQSLERLVRAKIANLDVICVSSATASSARTASTTTSLSSVVAKVHNTLLQQNSDIVLKSKEAIKYFIAYQENRDANSYIESIEELELELEDAYHYFLNEICNTLAAFRKTNQDNIIKLTIIIMRLEFAITKKKNLVDATSDVGDKIEVDHRVDDFAKKQAENLINKLKKQFFKTLKKEIHIEELYRKRIITEETQCMINLIATATKEQIKFQLIKLQQLETEQRNVILCELDRELDFIIARAGVNFDLAQEQAKSRLQAQETQERMVVISEENTIHNDLYRDSLLSYNIYMASYNKRLQIEAEVATKAISAKPSIHRRGWD